LEIQSQPVLGTDVEIVSSQGGKIDESYTLPAGKSKEVRNQCNTVARSTLRETKEPKRAASPWRPGSTTMARRSATWCPSRTAMSELRIANERTQFVVAKDATTYPANPAQFPDLVGRQLPDRAP
jgi:hypothetical protein